jgi:hypothetical protein
MTLQEAFERLAELSAGDLLDHVNWAAIKEDIGGLPAPFFYVRFLGDDQYECDCVAGWMSEDE